VLQGLEMGSRRGSRQDSPWCQARGCHGQEGQWSDTLLFPFWNAEVAHGQCLVWAPGYDQEDQACSRWWYLGQGHQASQQDWALPSPQEYLVGQIKPRPSMWFPRTPEEKLVCSKGPAPGRATVSPRDPLALPVTDLP
jgi:hypothetical protein